MRTRIVAIVLIGVGAGLGLAFLIARSDLAGADFRAYWGAGRFWLAGLDPHAPPAPYLPYVYPPWLLPLIAPISILPWSVAWTAWRLLNILLLAWSVGWAYQRRPLATAVLFTVLLLPLAATLDTGNITLVVTLVVWVAGRIGAPAAGAFWALSVATKVVPAIYLPLLPPRARLWGIAAIVGMGLLSLATLPQMLRWFDILIDYPRPIRLDYLLLLWGAVPWLWAQPDPWHRSVPAAITRGVRSLLGLSADRQDGTARPVSLADARMRLGSGLRAFLGVG